MSPPTLSADKASALASSDGSPVPLLGVSVSARVFGAHARVVLRQRYQNREARAIEAVYTFPVPSEAALVGFAMEAAGRRIEAEVKEREAAFRAYDEALSRGHGAALLEEERRNVFTASVGNLLPGEETVIEVEYVEPLAADEGALRFVIPTLVAPRYIPGSESGAPTTGHGVAAPTDRVPDADRISPAIGAVSYGLAVEVIFDLGRAVTVESPSHPIRTSGVGSDAVRVTFTAGEVPLDRDLVLVAAGAPGVAAGVIAERKAGEEGTFALTVVPDLFDASRRAAARDVVFVVDVSGSMEGDSLREAKSALRLCLRQLGEGDRFQIIAFSDTFFTFQPALVPYTQSTLSAADQWVAALATIGGTEMLEPLVAATQMLADSGARDRIVVLLTDGQVGNESEIVERVASGAGRARVYTFGIGASVSDLLLRDLARRTRGGVTFIHPGERIDEKVTAQFARATATRVEGLTLRFDGVDPGELAPAEVGDLVDGEPWVVFGRYDEPGHGKAELRGTLRGEPFFLAVPMDLPAEASREGLTALWATRRIRDLEEARLAGRRAESNKERIVALSIAHRVASKHASFILVEKRTGDRRMHDLPEARPVPVSAPAGWAIAQAPMEEEVQTMVGGFAAAPAAAAFASYDAMRSDDEGFSEIAEAEPAAEGDFAPAIEMLAYAPPPPPPPPGFAPPPACAAPAPAYAPMLEREEREVDGPADPVAALFATQLASGLFGGDDDSDEARLAATVRALEACAAGGIDSAHAVYGAQVKKAIEALCALSTRLTASAAELALDLDRALDLASRLASGRRLKATVGAALAAVRA